MKIETYNIEYILMKEEKGVMKEYSLGSREISLNTDGPLSKEALAFRRASRKQIEANKLIITKVG